MVTGFQVIAQPADFYRSRPGKLYASHTMQCQTSAIVEVEQNGEFLVSVIPVLGETGIVTLVWNTQRWWLWKICSQQQVRLLELMHWALNLFAIL